ncbi:MAG: DUF2723 domain-containing protein [Gammaproteobacteria bacterium]|nr:DUF2723 domain-containing protein [Gammaproteobacteria bacterium]
MSSSRLTGDRWLAWIAALAWAISINFWSQAIIIEVYTLAAALFVACWWLLIRFVETREVRWWLFACLAFGLSLSNHWPLMLLSAPMWMATWWLARRRLVRTRRIARGGRLPASRWSQPDRLRS